MKPMQLGDVDSNPGAITVGDGVAGDVGGTLPGGTVVGGIQGVPVSATPPTDGQELVYVAADGQWEPKDETPAAITVEDEGTPLETPADTLNFVGAGVTASGTGTTKTITIPGGSFVPTYIGPAETFTVPADRQALWAVPIDCDGTLDVVGTLVEVS